MDGREVMGCIDISKATSKEDYNAEKDVKKYDANDIASYCVVEKGEFCIFYPHDIHGPGMAFENNPSNVRKIVVKIHI